MNGDNIICHKRKKKRNMGFFTKFSHMLSFGNNVVVSFCLQRCYKLHTFTIDYESKRFLLLNDTQTQELKELATWKSNHNKRSRKNV